MGDSVIYPDAVKSPINQHFAMVIITHTIWVWYTDALTPKVKKKKGITLFLKFLVQKKTMIIGHREFSLLYSPTALFNSRSIDMKRTAHGAGYCFP